MNTRWYYSISPSPAFGYGKSRYHYYNDSRGIRRPQIKMHPVTSHGHPFPPPFLPRVGDLHLPHDLHSFQIYPNHNLNHNHLHLPLYLVNPHLHQQPKPRRDSSENELSNNSGGLAFGRHFWWMRYAPVGLLSIPVTCYLLDATFGGCKPNRLARFDHVLHFCCPRNLL